MIDEEIQKQIPLSSLPSRYGVGRTAVYSRIQSLKLEPIRKGKKAFLTESQIKLLDQLHEYLSQGDSIKEASAKIFSVQNDSFSDIMFSEQVSEQITLKRNDLLNLMESLINQKHKDCLAPQRALEEAYQNCWEITSSQLAQILEIKAKNLSKYHSLERYGFILTKIGRQSSETTWKVTKRINNKG
jgi:hypothetical protein